MTIPIATITSFRTVYNPFSRASRPCRLLLGMLRTPDTIPTSSPTHIDIQVKQLPRNSTELPTMTVGFKGGKELTLDVGKRGLKIGDVIELCAFVYYITYHLFHLTIFGAVGHVGILKLFLLW